MGAFIAATPKGAHVRNLKTKPGRLFKLMSFLLAAPPSGQCDSDDIILCCGVIKVSVVHLCYVEAGEAILKTSHGKNSSDHNHHLNLCASFHDLQGWFVYDTGEQRGWGTDS
jgi:hypothetical protein